MPRPPAGIHNLRPNHSEWTPRTLITLDSETRTIPGTLPETLALRCWAAKLEDRRKPRKKVEQIVNAHGETGADLVEWLNEMTIGRESIWLYAHNLNFDLVTTRLPMLLVAAGWVITGVSVNGRAPWLTLNNGKCTLTVTDSWSWLPARLEELGELVGIRKRKLPHNDDSLETWLARCRQDVEALHVALLQLMAWWDRNGLGHWSITGAGCGWNAFRHTPSMYKITIDPSEEGQTEDRRFIYGGRRGTWRIGTMQNGPYLELDIVAAYPTIARELPLPVKRTFAFDSLDLDSHLIGSDQRSIVALCRVHTDVPRWPVRVAGHVWYPVGTFWTAIAGPEIAEAKRLGCLLEIGPGRAHRLGYALSEWATWCLDVQFGRTEDAPQVARLAAKNWGRTVIGKFATRGYERIELGPSPVAGWSYEEGIDAATQTRGGLVDIAGRRWWQAASVAGENAYPAVLAWVESECRLRLTRVIEAVGPRCVIQCDTDGMIVNQRTIGLLESGGTLIAPPGMRGPARTAWVLDQLDPIMAPLTLRIKRRASHVTVIGPQHTIVGGQRRFSGIPGDAEQDKAGVFQIQTWPKLQWQMQHGSAAGYVRPIMPRELKGPYPTGWVLSDGRVIPVEAQTRDDRITAIVPWLQMTARPPGAKLSTEQHPYLDGLW